MKRLDFAVGLVGAGSGLLAAAFFLYSANLDVPYTLDSLVGDLQLIGRWNSFGCWAAFFAALCATYAFCRQVWAARTPTLKERLPQAQSRGEMDLKPRQSPPSEAVH